MGQAIWSDVFQPGIVVRCRRLVANLRYRSRLPAGNYNGTVDRTREIRNANPADWRKRIHRLTSQA
jgi:hypothetical protein